MLSIYTCLTVAHDWRLVTLAGAVCLLACGVAISLFHRAQATQGRTRLIWLSLDAAAGGCGIWATHFIATLAYDQGVGVGYKLALTVLSLVFGVAITGVGLSIALGHVSRWAAVIGGAVVGVGIAAMHYTGMLALDLPGRIVWSFDLILASLALGIVFGRMAIFVAVKRDDLGHTLAAAVLLAIAIVSHHFTAMGALVFVPDPTRIIDTVSLSPAALSTVVAGIAAIILGMCLVAALSDRRSKDELRKQKRLLAGC